MTTDSRWRNGPPVATGFYFVEWAGDPGRVDLVEVRYESDRPAPWRAYRPGYLPAESCARIARHWHVIVPPLEAP
jgi:hypothetical protein